MDTIASLIKNHRLYGDFTRIKDTLAEHQFVCWIAGGAVRDFLLGREVNEFDLVTDATTEVLKELFPHAVLVGESFGVIKIAFNNSRDFFDLATFREESDYIDGRRPSQVKASTPPADSVRRDFTINAIYWDDANQVLRDYQGGLVDLQARLLKCVGLPKTRFSEDYLRIVRLMRFSIQLDFQIDPETLVAAQQLLPQIAQVSGERIWAEFKKIESAKAWDRALQSDLFRRVLVEVFGDSSLLTASSGDLGFTGLKLTRFFAAAYPEKDFSQVLKERLKISNAELEDYKITQVVLQTASQVPVENWVFEIEKSPKVKNILENLTEARLIPENLGREIDKLLLEFPTTLVTPQELVGLIPNQQISIEMKFIRLAQLGKKFKTKDEVVSYLKQKYA